MGALILFAPLPAEADVIPPDNSAADQYAEGFPTGAGDESSGSTRPTKSQSPIKRPTRNKFEGRGAPGAAAVELAVATAPYHSNVSRDGRSEGAASEQIREAESVINTTFGEGVMGSSGVGEVLGQTLGGSGGMGAALPIILLISMVLAALYPSRDFKRS